MGTTRLVVSWTGGKVVSLLILAVLGLTSYAVIRSLGAPLSRMFHQTKGNTEVSTLQRNRLSQLLNKARQNVLRLECERAGSKVSSSGGWCFKVSQKNSSSHVCDKSLANAISKMLKGQRVAGFGDGPGRYKEIHDLLKLMASYDAYDGSPYIDNITDNAVKFLDLAVPQYGLPIYDWIVCLEVAEHIPHQYQDIFVDNIARHARTGVILSWAVPTQGGLAHVNGQTREEVVRIMGKVGFAPDEVSTEVLVKAARVSWLKRNVQVYLRIPGMEPDENDS